ncbi:MAG TPA: Lrp/AsnC family transcriptional regulator [Thermoplasmata archaeon]|nr:Lrp/AsnC family transcriptional regulator [Thermoplasmata archaeon]
MRSEALHGRSMASPVLPPLPRGTELDVEILRVMYATPGVSITGIDPRLNASRVAQRLGISRARVAARLRAWTEFGFLRRYDVWPNPYLFGLTGATFDVRVADPLGKDEVLPRIGLVPGAVGGIDLVGPWIAATFVLPPDVAPARTASLLRGLRGVAEVGDAVPWTPPMSPRTLSPLERRIVRVLRRFPTDSLASVARHVGVSTRTMTSRYGRLLDDRAVWFVPVLDFRAIAEPVINLNLVFDTGAHRDAFARALRQLHPQSIPFYRTQFGPALPDTVGSFFVVVPSAARVEDLETWVRSNPGIQSQEALTMKRIFSFPETLDRLLELPAATVSPARRIVGR